MSGGDGVGSCLAPVLPMMSRAPDGGPCPRTPVAKGSPMETPTTPSPRTPLRRRGWSLALAGTSIGVLACLAVPAATAAAQGGTPPRPTMARQVALATARLAVNGRLPHAGRPEALTHARTDHLGTAAPSRAPGTWPPASMHAFSTVAPPGVPGVDVSGYQGSVNWATVAASGARFAYVKATEGTYYTAAASFAQQYVGSYNAGLIRGAYHFAIPDNSTGAAQADYFVAHGGGWSADGRTLPGMLDIEFNPYGAECYGLTQAQMAAWVASFDAEYQTLTGRPPLLYTNAKWWNACTGGSSVALGDPLAVALYGANPFPLPAGWPLYTIWQYTDHNTLGIDGDSFNGSVAGLASLALGSPTIAPPPPYIAPPPPPAPTLPSGGRLLPGTRLLSADGRYQVVMQTDGNLVEYRGRGRALWSSRTPGHPGAWAAMRPNGSLVVYETGNQVLFTTGTGGRGRSYALIRNTGSFVVRTYAGRLTWPTTPLRRR